MRVAPLATGPVTLDLRAGAVTDDAGNEIAATTGLFANTATVTTLTTTITQITPPRVGANFNIEVTFGRAVTVAEFDADDVIITGTVSTASAADDSPDVGTITNTGGTVFTVPITASVEEDLTIMIRQGAATAVDDGDDSQASSSITVTVDLSPPTGSIAPDPNRPVNADFTIVATFNEDVTAPAAITVSGAPAGATVGTISAVSATEYRADVTLPTADPTAGGTLTFSIATDAVADLVGLNPAAAITGAVTVDRVAPELLFEFAGSETPTTPVSGDFVVSIQFDEPIEGFDADDVSFGVVDDADNTMTTPTNLTSTLTPVTGSETTTFSLAVTAPATSQTIRVFIRADAAMDAATNSSAAATRDVVVDRDAPMPTLTPTAGNGTRVPRGFTLAVDFGEMVEGFAEDDITVSGDSSVTMNSLMATDANLGQYTVGITVDTNLAEEGSLTVTLADDAASDTAGNDSAGVAAMYTVDGVKPTVSTIAAVSGVTAPVDAEFDVEITFNEAVADVDADSFMATNGSVTGVTGPATGTNTYTVTIDPTANGSVRLQLLAGGAVDLAGNASDAATLAFEILAKKTPLTASITGDANVPRDFTVQVVFGTAIDVASFVPTDFNVTGATVNTISANPTGSETNFDVALVATASGTVTVRLPADTVLEKDTGVGNDAASFETTADPTGPVVTIALTPDDNVTHVTDDFDISITFDESVEGSFAESDIGLSTGATVEAGSFSADTLNRAYSATITLPATDGAVTITIAENAVMNAVNLGNDLTTRTVTADRVRPVVTFSGVPDAVNDDFDFTIRITDLSPPELTTGDVNLTGVTNATVSLAANTVPPNSGYVEYTASVDVPDTPADLDATLTISVAAGAVADLAGNTNEMATTAMVAVDKVRPTVTLTHGITGNITEPFDVTITFDEEVTGLTKDEVVVVNTGATTGDLTLTSAAGQPSVFTLRVTPRNGALTVNLTENAAMDLAGNGNTAATELSGTVALSNPTVSITTDAGRVVGGTRYINTDSFVVTMSFSENVTGFDAAADLTATGATVTVPSGSGDTYTATVTPTADGTVTLSVPADAATGETSSTGNRANTASFIVDRAAPTVRSITPESAGPFNAAFEVTVVFSEPVQSFAAADLVAMPNATPAEPVNSGDDTTFTITITPDRDGEIIVQVSPDSVSDYADNAIGPDPTVARVAGDITAPTVTSITAESAGPFNAAFEVTVVFSEPVNGFAAADLADMPNATPGEPANDSGDRTNFTVTITPDMDGAIAVQVLANSVTDDAGTMNAAASATVNVVADLTAPTVASVTTTAGATVTGAFDVTVEFSEAVTGFAAEDMEVSNGTAGAPVSSTTAGEENRIFTVGITPLADGPVTVRVAANAVQDDAGNQNAAASSDTVMVTADLPNPTVLLSSTAPDPVEDPFSVSVVFSRAVSGFEADDMVLTNSTAAAPANASGDKINYTVEITPVTDGPITVQVRANAVTADDDSLPNVAASNIIRRDAVLTAAPGKPTGLSAVGGRQAITLSWVAPAAGVGAAAIIGYRIEYSDTGTSGDFDELVANTGRTIPNYRHTGLGDSQTVWYQVSAINSARTGPASDSASGTTLAELMPDIDMVDSNDDGRITGVDANALYFQLVGLETNPAVRRTLLEPLLPDSIVRSGDQAVDQEINRLLQASVGDVDVNGDGVTDASDAQLIHNIKSFPELVGNGRSGGFLAFRQSLVGRFLPGGNPSDAEMMAIIRIVRAL